MARTAAKTAKRGPKPKMKAAAAKTKTPAAKRSKKSK